MPARCKLRQGGLGLAVIIEVPGESIVKRIKKVVLLELRKEHLAMGYAMRRNIDIHFFDPEKLVRKWRTKGLHQASKPSCVDPCYWPRTC